jgi:hypothetical protein
MPSHFAVEGDVATSFCDSGSPFAFTYLISRITVHLRANTHFCGQPVYQDPSALA